MELQRGLRRASSYLHNQAARTNQNQKGGRIEKNDRPSMEYRGQRHSI